MHRPAPLRCIPRASGQARSSPIGAWGLQILWPAAAGGGAGGRRESVSAGAARGSLVDRILAAHRAMHVTGPVTCTRLPSCVSSSLVHPGKTFSHPRANALLALLAHLHCFPGPAAAHHSPRSAPCSPLQRPAHPPSQQQQRNGDRLRLPDPRLWRGQGQPPRRPPQRGGARGRRPDRAQVRQGRHDRLHGLRADAPWRQGARGSAAAAAAERARVARSSVPTPRPLPPQVAAKESILTPR